MILQQEANDIPITRTAIIDHPQRMDLRYRPFSGKLSKMLRHFVGMQLLLTLTFVI